MDHRIYVVTCPDYNQVEEKLGQLLALMGGMERYVQAGEEILLKVNLLQPAPPEKAVSTHPAVTAAVAKQVLAAGGSAVIADSPGSGYHHTEAMLNNLYSTNGMEQAAAESGARLNHNLDTQEVSNPAGKLMKRLEVMTPVLEADGLFNLCKLKSHVFMSMTGAVKNNFGVIPGASKVGYHTKFQDKALFADMLLDLADFVSPRLNIMDAVVAMEGEGPGASGTPRAMGLLLAGENPLAIDVIAAEIIGLPKSDNPLLLAAEARGLSPTRPEEIELIGATLEELRVADFKLPGALRKDMLGLPKSIGGVTRQVTARTPKVVPERCVGCGICRDSCPVSAITISERSPRKADIDTGKCIRCYCCHELCPKSAVALRGGLLSGFFHK